MQFTSKIENTNYVWRNQKEKLIRAQRQTFYFYQDTTKVMDTSIISINWLGIKFMFKVKISDCSWLLYEKTY